MSKGKKKISEQAAIELLKRLFDSSPDKNSLNLQELYIAANRAELDEETNRNWLNAVMTKLRQHNLILPVYTYDGRKKLDQVKLTASGKSLLGRPNAPDETELHSDSVVKKTSEYVGVDQLTRTVSLFKKQNPDYEVTFRIELKEDTVPMM